MPKQGLIITGDRMIDRKLAGMDAKLQKKVIKKATRAGAKKILSKAKAHAPKDSGAMSKAIKVRAYSNRIKQATGKRRKVVLKDGREITVAVKRTAAEEFGAKTEITRKSLAKELAKRGNDSEAESLLTDTESYFYPAAFEWGTKSIRPHGTFRLSMKTSESEVLQEFRRELSKLLSKP